ncbi:MAG TPA: vitamin K epoxide reductase family protein [Nitrospirota bacterium]|nr:vitamin K epoxide reductase family protein [Nitrospirota bacterium]
MQRHKKTFDTIFLVASMLASLFVLTEIVLQSFGKSICAAEGCKMTAQSARFGDISIFLIGFATFFSIMAFTILNRRFQKPVIERLINLILVVALAGEGFFMGYLAFRIHTLCLFCVTIFCFMVTLGIMRLLSGEKDIIAGFAALFAIFIIQYLVLPAGVPLNLPTNERLILFYSKDCKHCAEVMKEFDDKKISVAHLPVKEYVGFLKNIGIETVPTLMINDPNQKILLTGTDAINRYLLACTVPKAVQAKAVKKKAPKKEVRVVPNSGATIDIFRQPDMLTAPATSAADEGMCKQDEICQ